MPSSSLRNNTRKETLKNQKNKKGVEILLFDLRAFCILFASKLEKTERKKMNDASFGE